ncbi:S8 family serine peptidase [Erysipelothrix tonsillarum]|uniref:S8 family serine peptidase n=1 Tax=Erysipelothrix tonsillarum TaxID=38402 RepID=UPI00035DC95B|nr:S8 family serine peptidase [Erysipelothrix tonsillarum]
MKKTYSSIALSVLSTALVFTSVSMNPVYADDTLKAKRVNDENIKRPINENENSIDDLSDVVDENEVVSIIVELHDAPIIETMDLDNSRAVINEQENLIETQEAVIEEIKQQVTQEELDVEYHYTVAMNGFSFKGAIKDIKQIDSLKSVKRAFRERRYYIPQMKYSNETVNATQVWNNSNYRGEGLTVAVLDTGLDTSHPAFSVDPVNPRYSKDDIQTIMDTHELHAESSVSNLDATDTYINDKVVYQFDYADEDNNVNPSVEKVGDLAHGTHVAGTVAGNNGSDFKGIAPEAQLMIFKVFSNFEKGAGDSVLFAALEDALMLDVDVINMSLGTPSGFIQDPDHAVNDVYKRITDAGIIVDVSAGNSTTAAQENLWGLNLTLSENMDNGIVGSPSTLNGSLSVASVDNTVMTSYIIESNGRRIPFTDTPISFMHFLNQGEMDVVVVPGIGTPEDIASVKDELNGNIALIERGTIGFNTKVQNAEKANAKGVIIYDNIDGPLLNMVSDDNAIPAIFISHEDGEFIKNHPDKKVKVNETMDESAVNTASLPSDFSSMGTTNSLSIKPEISAPGGHIYSAYPTQSGKPYDSMSGTSMASPNVAGGSALVKQAVMDRNPSMNKVDAMKLTNNLLMSTAIPVVSPDNGAHYPVRKQGSGMMDVNAAVLTNAYLTMDPSKTIDGSDRPKVELGDDVNQTGAYSFDFNVVNVSDHAITYNVESFISVPDVEEHVIDGTTRIFMKDTNINPSFIDAGSDASVTVQPHSETSIHIEIKLDEATKTYLNSNFKNGAYVEGFTYLRAAGEVDLSIPFLGFYGDWEKAPIFDKSSWFDEEDESSNFTHIIGSSIGTQGGGALLGQNLLDGSDHSINKEMFTISPNGDYIFDSIDIIQIGQVRNADTMNFVVKDKVSGQEVYRMTYDQVVKTRYIKEANQQVPGILFQDLEPIGENLADGKYELLIQGDIGYRDGVDDTYAIDLLVDTVEPVIDKGGAYKITEEGGRYFLEMDAVDDNYLIQSSVVQMYNNAPIWSAKLFEKSTSSEPVSKHTIKVDVTDFENSKVMVSLIDSGYNESDYVIELPGFKALSLSSESVDLDIEQSVKIHVVQGSSEGMVWTSDDNVIASVVDGVITGHSAGQATITAKNAKGESAQVVVNVSEGEVVSSMTLTTDEMHLVAGKTGMIDIASVEPAGTKVEFDEVIWSIDDESVATVDVNPDYSATVTAKNITDRTATVTATYRGVSASAVVAVSPVGTITPTYTGTNVVIPVGYPFELGAKDSTSSPITWSVADSDIVSIDSDAYGAEIIGLKVGKTVVTATSANGTLDFDVTVVSNFKAPISFNFNETLYEGEVGDEMPFNYIFDGFGDVEDIVSIKANKENVIDIQADKFVAMNEGKVQVTAKAINGAKATTIVHVVDPARDSLNSLITDTNVLDASVYTPASWETLANALKEANDALAAGNQTHDDYVALMDAINQAVLGLKVAVTNLPETVTVQVGDQFTLDPKPVGGAWDFDTSYLDGTAVSASLTRGPSSRMMFTALKAGDTVVTYESAEGVKYSVAITIKNKAGEKPGGGNTPGGNKPGGGNTPGDHKPGEIKPGVNPPTTGNASGTGNGSAQNQNNAEATLPDSGVHVDYSALIMGILVISGGLFIMVKNQRKHEN